MQEILQCLGLQGRVGTVLEKVESFSENMEVLAVHDGAGKIQEVERYQEGEHSLAPGESMVSAVLTEKEMTPQKVVKPLKFVTRRKNVKPKKFMPQKVMLLQKEEVMSQKAERPPKEVTQLKMFKGQKLSKWQEVNLKSEKVMSQL